MVAWDTRSGAIFANEAPLGPGADFLELMATGPQADDQPGPTERLEDWLEAKLAPAGRGVGNAQSIVLPAGRGIVIDRVVEVGTPNIWRFAAYAIRTPAGVGYLLLDGPPNLWAVHEADMNLIPLLMELGPGR
jgi:hypothetical protein